MLVSKPSMGPMPTGVVLLMVMMVVLRSMMLLMTLMRILVAQIHWHISLMTLSSIHHNLLPLLMPLIEHAVRVVRGLLDRRVGG